MNMEAAHKVGDIIKIENKQFLKGLREWSDSRKAIEVSMIDMAKQAAQLSRRFWSSIFEMYPELSEYDLTFDTETGEIAILRTLRPSEQESRMARLKRMDDE